MHNTYEWCSEGVVSQQEFCQNMDISLMNLWMEEFKKGNRYDILDIRELKEEHPDTYEALCVQNIHALSTAPLLVKGEIRGYVGVDDPHCAEREHLDKQQYYRSHLPGERYRFCKDAALEES